MLAIQLKAVNAEFRTILDSALPARSEQCQTSCFQDLNAVYLSMYNEGGKTCGRTKGKDNQVLLLLCLLYENLL